MKLSKLAEIDSDSEEEVETIKKEIIIEDKKVEEDVNNQNFKEENFNINSNLKKEQNDFKVEFDPIKNAEVINIIDDISEENVLKSNKIQITGSEEKKNPSNHNIPLVNEKSFYKNNTNK